MATKKARKKSKRLTPAEQHLLFVETAKKAEPDERPEEFDKVFKRVALASKAVERKRSR